MSWLYKGGWNITGILWILVPGCTSVGRTWLESIWEYRENGGGDTASLRSWWLRSVFAASSRRASFIRIGYHTPILAVSFMTRIYCTVAWVSVIGSKEIKWQPPFVTDGSIFIYGIYGRSDGFNKRPCILQISINWFNSSCNTVFLQNRFSKKLTATEWFSLLRGSSVR